MKLGVQLIGPRNSKLGAIAKAAEDAGWDSAFIASPHGLYPGVTHVLDATQRIKVGTSIMPCFHATPFMHAASAMFLQEISGGRFILGMGSQTKGQVRTQAGFDPPKPAKMAKEVIEIIRLLMHSAGPVEYKGEFYNISTGGMRRGGIGGGAIEPPPIYFSGVNMFNLRVAGEISEGFIAHPIFTERFYKGFVWPNIEIGLNKVKKSRQDFEMCAMPMFWIAENEAERRDGLQRGKRNLANYCTTRAYGGYMDFHGWTKEKEGIYEIIRGSGGRANVQALEDIFSDEIIDEVCLIGTPEEIRQKARERYKGIADHLLLYPVHGGGGEQEHHMVEEQMFRIVDVLKGFNAQPD